MANASPSAQFLHLANAWRLLSIRSDVDDIILELLGRFSLEKIYADGDPERFQQVVSTLLAQLNAIFYVQRLSLPSESEQDSFPLGILASWEIIVRAVELTLQVIIEGRDNLWSAQTILEKQLGDLVSTALRILFLHPKASYSESDRKDRFNRIHGLLERLFDSYPGRKSFLLHVCVDVADNLRSEPSVLDLPMRLSVELPNLVSDLYPLRECLSAGYVSTIVERDGNSGYWLPQFLALRDVAQFVIGASVQYAVHGETRDASLLASCAKTRNVILTTIDKLRLPQNLSKMEVLTTFTEAFQIILPDTPSPIPRQPSDMLSDSSGVEAIKELCLSLSRREVVHRASDQQVMRAMSEITRSISLLDDPSGKSYSAYPRAYAVNCPSCHLIGDSQFRYYESLEFPYLSSSDNLDVLIPEQKPDAGAEIGLPSNTKCVQCRQTVTIAREIPLAREAYTLLSSIEYDADPINAQRHVSSLFKLSPTKVGSHMPFHRRGSTDADADTQLLPEVAYIPPFSPEHGHDVAISPVSIKRSPSIGPENFSPISPEAGRETPLFRHDLFPQPQKPAVSIDQIVNHGGDRLSPHQQPPVGSTPRNVPEPFLPRAMTRSPPPDKSKSKWKGIIPLGGPRKESTSTVADTKSLSSATLEAQKPDEICLRNLTNAPKPHGKGKGVKNINVCLSQNSTHALFWTPPTIQVWEIGMSPAALVTIIQTDGSCLLAAVTRKYLAYMVGSRDQKLALRIVKLAQPTAPALEYRMPSSQWCKSIAICPKEDYVVVGFENAIARFFKTTGPEPQREFRLHQRYHAECKSCPSVDKVSFSNEGHVLLASTRHPKSGIIQTYQWKSPFMTFIELSNCHYRVPPHESEDNGISSVLYGTGTGEENLICITTWTQSGVPVLMQPEDGHKVEIKADTSSHQRRLGNRIQCAAFSLSGRRLAMVNNKGHMYLVSNLNSSVMEARRLAVTVTKDIPVKSNSFAMSFMMLHDDESIVLAWSDASKSTGYVKKIPVPLTGDTTFAAPADVVHVPQELPGNTDNLTGSSSGSGFGTRSASTRSVAIRTPSARSNETKDPTKEGGILLPRHYVAPSDIKIAPKPPVELAATDGLSAASRPG